MILPSDRKGRVELRSALFANSGLLWATGLFSIVVNLLVLAGPLYMLQLYDRVMGSRSVATLVALTVLVAFLYAMMGLMDMVRGQLMSRVSARFEERLGRRVFEASMRQAAIAPQSGTEAGQRELDSVQRLITSPVLMALMDMPWTPVFLLGITLFHPLLGMLAAGGGAVLIIVALINQAVTRHAVRESTQAAAKAGGIAAQIRGDAAQVQSCGMLDTSFTRWQEARREASTQTLAYTDKGGAFSAFTKSFRLFLQSAMLGLGAYLALNQEVSPGAMIAGSILLGRALAPVEMAIGQWLVVQQARQSWGNLAQLLSVQPPEPAPTELPRPRARLHVEQLSIVPPGEKQATLRAINFLLSPGQAMGVIGPSGAGKSTLARALTGVWPPAAGTIRLDGATLSQYGREVLGRHVGYLPQQVHLFEGTVADNIARLTLAPDAQKVVEAAQRAGAHEMILKLPKGYDTPVNGAGGGLSGGQIQRIGLARALYDDPVILVLDEPNSNLDNDGTVALNTTIRRLKSEGKSVILMAHRPSALQECELLMMLDNGTRAAFGPRDEVLRAVTTNNPKIATAQPAGRAK
ncbi:type I secretion system permease/ATPase [Pararhodobacter sp. CCB-MM2]|uniref:type I secretion system permease/ATPase n=1 Tax=Pararhodobacter sp. CCB-MM2 TaxID=1786003 RepID=UPI000833B206|nr:type I secretion system permease/ATPase [Pararhodobacter sp. CCB-MM2]